MGTSEDKVKLLSKDQIEAPFPDVEVEDENTKEDSGHIWRFVCYALAFMMVVGVFLSAITFQNSSTDEQSFSRDAGLLILLYVWLTRKNWSGKLWLPFWFCRVARSPSTFCSSLPHLHLPHLHLYRFSNWYDLGNVILKKTLLKRFEVDSILQFWVSQTICFSDGFISTLFEVLYLLPHCFWCDT